MFYYVLLIIMLLVLDTNSGRVLLAPSFNFNNAIVQMPKGTTRCKLSQDTVRISLYHFIQLLSIELL